MKHIRKIIVAVLAIAVIATSAIVPAMAENSIPQTNNGMAVTGRGGMGGPGGFGGRGGQMPGNQQNGQQMPGNQRGGRQGMGQMPQNGQMPNDNLQNNDQNNNGQQPQDNNCQQMPGRMGKGFKGGRGHRDMLNLDALVQDGTLSQETRDAIDKYMSEKKQEQKEDRMTSLLDELKDAGVITDEEYDAIEAAKPAQPADAPAEAPADAPEAPADGEAPADAPEMPEQPADGEAPEAPADQTETQE